MIIQKFQTFFLFINVLVKKSPATYKTKFIYIKNKILVVNNFNINKNKL